MCRPAQVLQAMSDATAFYNKASDVVSQDVTDALKGCIKEANILQKDIQVLLCEGDLLDAMAQQPVSKEEVTSVQRQLGEIAGNLYLSSKIHQGLYEAAKEFYNQHKR